MAVAGQPCIGLQVQVGWNVAVYAKTYFLFQTVKKKLIASKFTMQRFLIFSSLFIIYYSIACQ